MIKKTILGFSMVLLASLVVVSCKKENAKPNSRAEQVKDNSELPDKKRLPDIILTPTSDYFCGTQIPCGTTTYATTRNNRVFLTKHALTIASYPNLRYTYYKSSGTVGGVETFTRIAQYTCNDDVVNFASSLLDNATRIYVIANQTFNSAPPATVEYTAGYISTDGSAWGTWGGALAVTTSFKGQNCMFLPFDPRKNK